jgi:branched-chain amino acid transport system ATP-binding protein
MAAKEGEITVIVGPNGSGKSTLLKSIFGLATVYSGSIALDEEQLTHLPPHQIARKGVAYLPQVDNVFSNLTVRENLSMAGYAVDKQELTIRVQEATQIFPILTDYSRRVAGTMSGGERQMLAMGMALLRKPRVLMFDEPTGNLSPKLTSQVLSKIEELKDRLGIAVILVEQSARKALAVGQKCYLMVSGKPIFEGKPNELLSRPEFGELYLGIKAQNESGHSESSP